MNILNRLIKNEGLVPLIIVVIILILVNSFLLFKSYSTLLKSETNREQAELTLATFTDIWDQVKSSDLGVRSFLLTGNEEMLNPHTTVQSTYPVALNRLDSLLSVQGVFKKEFEAYRSNYNKKMAEANQMIRLMRSGERETAMAIFDKDSGYDLWLNYYAPLQSKLVVYENQIIEEAENNYLGSFSTIQTSQIFLLVLSIPVLILVVYRIRRNNRKRKELYLKLENSNKHYVFDSGVAEETGTDENSVIGSIINNLDNSTNFIQQITSGNYEVKWEGLNEDNEKFNQTNLAGNLIKMRNQMKIARDEDKKRIWATEGYSLFSDITRKYPDDSQELYDEFVSQLVNYLKINQAALFVLYEDDNEQYLNLQACYAYSRKKYMEKRISPGQGLIGQTYLEGQTFHLKKVPEDYIRITSGLGEANPKSLLIVPMIYNEKIVGILELASFKDFQDHEIKFVEELGKILGATLEANHASKTTKTLLKTMQEQAEELKLQEEEMRQSMEELEATREEMKRQYQELELKHQKTLIENNTLAQKLMHKSERSTAN